MRSAAVRLGCVIMIWLLGWTVSPARAVPDIADFNLGISWEETLLRTAVPCGEQLCGEVNFGGRTWGGTFQFDGGILSAISLFGPLEDAYVNAAFEGFAGSPYVVYRALTGESSFDFPEKAAQGLQGEELDAAFQEFLRGLRGAGDSFVSYLYTEPEVYEAMEEAARERMRATDQRKGDTAPAGGQDKTEAATDGNQDTAPEVPDGVVCGLTIDEDGVTILIMRLSGWEREMARRAANGAPLDGEKKAADPGVGMENSAEKG